MSLLSQFSLSLCRKVAKRKTHNAYGHTDTDQHDAFGSAAIALQGCRFPSPPANEEPAKRNTDYC
jgi:hypothetical protein